MKNIKMKKINLKNILKKTFKKKKSKKTRKKNKTLKKAKKVKKNLKTKNLKKKSKEKFSEKNKITETLIAKQDNLKVSKNSDLKPEIKKIKIQPSEKKLYKAKDYVVYPKHGVGQITEFKKINIGGIDVECLYSQIRKR